MRIYDSATIKEELLTGFQSPCSEFAAKPISFDERFGIGNPALKLLTVQHDFPLLGIFKNDKLLVDLSKRPTEKSLVITIMDEEVRLLQGSHLKKIEGLMAGVVQAVIREVY